jgi:hypothetical protein
MLRSVRGSPRYLDDQYGITEFFLSNPHIVSLDRACQLSVTGYKRDCDDVMRVRDNSDSNDDDDDDLCPLLTIDERSLNFSWGDISGVGLVHFNQITRSSRAFNKTKMIIDRIYANRKNEII